MGVEKDEGLAVHYQKLRHAAHISRQAANDLVAQVNEHVAACGAPGDQHRTWDSAAALNECVSAWHTHLHGHAEETHGIGQHFHRTHTTYANAEVDSHGNVHHVDGLIPPPTLEA